MEHSGRTRDILIFYTIFDKCSQVMLTITEVDRMPVKRQLVYCHYNLLTGFPMYIRFCSKTKIGFATVTTDRMPCLSRMPSNVTCGHGQQATNCCAMLYRRLYKLLTRMSCVS